MDESELNDDLRGMESLVWYSNEKWKMDGMSCCHSLIDLLIELDGWIELHSWMNNCHSDDLLMS